MPRRTVPPEEILEDHTPEVKAVANHLREMIKKTVEGAQGTAILAGIALATGIRL